MGTSLQSFSPEILHSIIRQLDVDGNTLLPLINISVTCRQLCDIAREYIFRHPVVHAGADRSGNLLDLLHQRPDIRRLVRTITLESANTKNPWGLPHSLDAFTTFIQTAPRLHTVKIHQTPTFPDFNALEQFPRALFESIRQLENLKVELHCPSIYRLPFDFETMTNIQSIASTVFTSHNYPGLTKRGMSDPHYLASVITNNAGLKSLALTLFEMPQDSNSDVGSIALEEIGKYVPSLISLNIDGPFTLSDPARELWRSKLSKLRFLSLSSPEPILDFARSFKDNLPALRDLRLNLRGSAFRKYTMPDHEYHISQIKSLLSATQPSSLMLENFDLDTMFYAINEHGSALKSLLSYCEDTNGLSSYNPDSISMAPFHAPLSSGVDQREAEIRLVWEKCHNLYTFGTWFRRGDFLSASTPLLYSESIQNFPERRNRSLLEKESHPHRILEALAKFRNLCRLYVRVWKDEETPLLDPGVLVSTFIYLQRRKLGLMIERMTVLLGFDGWVISQLGREHLSVKSYNYIREDCVHQVWNTETLSVCEEKVLESGNWKEEFAHVGLRFPHIG